MSNTLTNLIYHVVFSTKNRDPLILKEFQPRIYAYIRAIIEQQGGIPLASGGMPDHVHLLVKLRTNQPISDLIRLIKANSSKWANEQDKTKNSFSWQTGYGAFTVSASSIEVVKNYIQGQERHHQVRSFKDEFVDLLVKQGIEFDARYLWN